MKMLKSPNRDRLSLIEYNILHIQEAHAIHSRPRPTALDQQDPADDRAGHIWASRGVAAAAIRSGDNMPRPGFEAPTCNRIIACVKRTELQDQLKFKVSLELGQIDGRAISSGDNTPRPGFEAPTSNGIIACVKRTEFQDMLKFKIVILMGEGRSSPNRLITITLI